MKVKHCQCVSVSNYCLSGAPLSRMWATLNFPLLNPTSSQLTKTSRWCSRRRALRTQSSSHKKGRESVRVGVWVDEWKRTCLPFLGFASMSVPTPCISMFPLPYSVLPKYWIFLSIAGTCCHCTFNQFSPFICEWVCFKCLKSCLYFDSLNISNFTSFAHMFHWTSFLLVYSGLYILRKQTFTFCS